MYESIVFVVGPDDTFLCFVPEGSQDEMGQSAPMTASMQVIAQTVDTSKLKFPGKTGDAYDGAVANVLNDLVKMGELYLTPRVDLCYFDSELNEWVTYGTDLDFTDDGVIKEPSEDDGQLDLPSV